jgi:hypothetical protein
MKKMPILFLFALTLFVTACSSGDSSNIVTPQHPYANRIGRSIPNWATDTLIGTTSHYPYTDTIFSYSQNAHSYIKYHGVAYELWDERHKSDAWDPNAQVYADGNIGFYMNDSTSITACIAYPATYIIDSVVHVQAQELKVLAASPFDSTVTDGVYKHVY